MDKIVVFRVAWMKKYDGATAFDAPIGGGSFVNLNQTGSEIYNFRSCERKMYGFVEPGFKPKPRRIGIHKLGASKKANQISGVLVIWVARNPDTRKTVVIGWYKNATIHRERQIPSNSSDRLQIGGTQAPYFAEADEQDCELLEIELQVVQEGRSNCLCVYSELRYGTARRCRH